MDATDTSIATVAPRLHPFPAHRGPAPYSFVSYAHADAEVVYADLAWLHARSVPLWYDEGIEPGSDWRDALADALATCSLFVFFASERSLASPYCRQEVNFALARDRRVLVVHLEPVRLPNALEFSLADRQALPRYLYEAEEFRTRLHTAILERGTSVRPSAARPAKPPRSIAVMPLATLGIDDDHLGQGIAAELVAALGRVRDIRTATRSASFALESLRDRPAEIAERLDVRYVLDGTLRRAGDRLRVTIELYDAESGHVVLGDRYDRVIEDIFDVQGEIAEAMVAALESEFGRGLGHELVDTGTRDATAYQHYLLAEHRRYQFTPDGLADACDHLRRALEADPDYLDARVLLINLLEAQRVFYEADVDDEIAPLEARARALDAEEGRLNWFWMERDRAATGVGIGDAKADEALFREMIFHAEHPAAAGVNPSRWFSAGFSVTESGSPTERALACYGLLLAQAGLYELALDFFDRSGAYTLAIPCCQIALQRHDEALAFLRLYQDDYPDIMFARIGHVGLLERLGRFDAADVERARLDPLLNDDLRTVVAMQRAFWKGDTADPATHAARLDALGIPPFFRGMCALWADADAAAAGLRRAMDGRDFLMRNARLWLPLNFPPEIWRAFEARDDVRALMAEMGLEGEWRDELEPRARGILRRLDGANGRPARRG